MDPAAPPPAATPPPDAVTSRRWRRFLVVVVLATLAVLVAFHDVLFPFVMAAFLAYLVEPVVDWMNRERRLGIRWGRAPVLILLYLVLIVGVVSLVSCGAHRVSESARRAASDLKRELSKTAPAVHFVLERPATQDLWIPEGTLVREEDGRAWVTLFPEQIGTGLTETRVLLGRAWDRDPPPPPPPADGHRNLRRAESEVVPQGSELTLEGAESLGLPPGTTLRVTADAPAKGLEIFTETWVISPIRRQIERWTGDHFDPGLVRDFVVERSREHGDDAADKAVAWSRSGVLAVAGSTYRFFLILMIAAFLVIDRRRISRFFHHLPPPELRAGWASLLGYVDRGLAGVIRGQIVICVVNGLLTWAGLLLLGVPYATLLAFVAGVFSLIPVFGTIASSIPIVLVALAANGPASGALALGWIFLIHLLEANVFNPLIMGTSAELHPVVIVFALLAGEHAFGVWGALLAVPAASVLISGFKYYRHEVLGVPPEEPHGHGLWLRKLLARRQGKAPTPPAGGTS